MDKTPYDSYTIDVLIVCADLDYVYEQTQFAAEYLTMEEFNLIASMIKRREREIREANGLTEAETLRFIHIEKMWKEGK